VYPRPESDDLEAGERAEPIRRAGIMDCKTRLERYLRENGVPYSVHHHPPAFTAQAVAEKEHVSGGLSPRW
jgi:hypothetical protein